MTTFDSWEVAVRPPEDYLMHFRTPGSKNGVRRYQLEDGTWTPLGLRERKAREGWGDEGTSRAERKAAKRLAKAEKALAKSEKHAAKKAARIEKKEARAEKKRLSSLKGLTDAEMKQKLERAKMEAEYKELTKRTSLIEKGSELIGKYLNYKDNKEQRALEMNRQKVQLEQAKTQAIQAKNAPKKAKAEARKAKFEAKNAKEARKKADITKDADLLKAKMDYKNYTVRGGIGKRINMMLTSGKAKQYEAVRKAKGDVEANRTRSEGASKLANKQLDQYRSDTKQRRKEAYEDAYEAQKEAKKWRKKFSKV